MNEQDIKTFVPGTSKLPATFTTAYVRDLETARKIIRARRDAALNVGTKPAPEPESMATRRPS